MTAAEKVRALRAAGYRVFISHRRLVAIAVEVPDASAPIFVSGLDLMTAREAAEQGLTPMQYGGTTTVAVRMGDGTAVADSQAVCSQADRFSRRLGLEIAVGRLLKANPMLRDVVASSARERA